MAGKKACQPYKTFLKIVILVVKPMSITTAPYKRKKKLHVIMDYAKRPHGIAIIKT
jgi:hypothetical protein